MEAVVAYLDKVDPEAADARAPALRLLRPLRRAMQEYGYAAGVGAGPTVRERGRDPARRPAGSARPSTRGATAGSPRTSYFFAEQNARLVGNAEEYYRTMFRGRVASWNLRDRHMADTLDALLGLPRRHAARRAVVVWAHNSHLGDARATEMGEARRVNVGQLVRERVRRGDAVLVGFTTYAGTVTAASDWDGPAERKRVRPALAGSYESCSTRPASRGSCCRCGRDLELASALAAPRLERAIGVIYRPETERVSHYFHARSPSSSTPSPLRRDARRRAARAHGRVGAARCPRRFRRASE